MNYVAIVRWSVLHKLHPVEYAKNPQNNKNSVLIQGLLCMHKIINSHGQPGELVCGGVILPHQLTFREK